MTMKMKAAMTSKWFDLYDGLPGMEKELFVCKLHISSLVFCCGHCYGACQALFCSNRILVSRGIGGLRHVASAVEHSGGYDVAFEH